MPLLEANNLHKTYRLGRVDVPVLHGASLAVERGECVAVLGKSGSGKSTLLHLLGGLDRPDSRAPGGGPGGGSGGEVLFEGRSLRAYGAGERDRYRASDVGFVFQFYHLLPELTVMQNVLVASMIRHGRLGYVKHGPAAKSRAAELLDRFGLSNRLRHRPVELSGGERQRVAIARALINEPKVLLADEPTGNLDQSTGSSILDAMMDHRRSKDLTMVIVTHDEAVAKRADRVVRLREGRVE